MMRTWSVLISCVAAIVGCHGGGGNPDGGNGDDAHDGGGDGGARVDAGADGRDGDPGDGIPALDAGLGADGSPGTDADVDAAPMACGFDSPAASWTLPPGAGTRDFAAFFFASNDDGTFNTVDLDGDARPDLVFSRRWDDDTVGYSRWLIHRGVDGGFVPVAAPWSLPATDGPFRYAGHVGNDWSVPRYDLRDLDGDARPELIVTYRADNAPTGTTRWDVYRNEGDGFAATSTPWALPPGYPETTFAALRGEQRCPAPDFETFDIDGDHRPDLVVADDCASTYATSWRVHRNNGTGFDAIPAIWTIPFPEYYYEYCLTGYDYHVTFARLDLDGDGRPDLVTTSSCTTDAIGSDHWLVHHNTGTGFAEDAQLWTLPGWPERYGTVSRRDEPEHLTTDLDGDDRPDLVVISREGTDLGTARWIVYPNTGAGFGAPQDWCLPGGYGDEPFMTMQYSLWGCPVWTLLDLDGDGTRGLAIADDHCNDATSTAGTDRWLVHGD